MGGVEYIKRATNGEYQALLSRWIGDNGDPDNFFSIFACASKQEGNNFSRWCDSNFDNLVSSARIELDTNKRVELYKRAQIIMNQEVPALIIANSTVYDVLRKEVVGYVMDPLLGHNFATVDISK